MGYTMHSPWTNIYSTLGLKISELAVIRLVQFCFHALDLFWIKELIEKLCCDIIFLLEAK